MSLRSASACSARACAQEGWPKPVRAVQPGSPRPPVRGAARRSGSGIDRHPQVDWCRFEAGRLRSVLLCLQTCQYPRIVVSITSSSTYRRDQRARARGISMSLSTRKSENRVAANMNVKLCQFGCHATTATTNRPNTCPQKIWVRKRFTYSFAHPLYLVRSASGYAVPCQTPSR